MKSLLFTSADAKIACSCCRNREASSARSTTTVGDLETKFINLLGLYLCPAAHHNCKCYDVWPLDDVTTPWACESSSSRGRRLREHCQLAGDHRANLTNVQVQKDLGFVADPTPSCDSCINPAQVQYERKPTGYAHELLPSQSQGSPAASVTLAGGKAKYLQG